MNRAIVAIPVAILAVVLIAWACRAAPPENADPALASWFQSLRQPGTGIGCCSIADCRPYNLADVRIGPKGYEIRYDGKWLAVPNDKIIQGKDNPLEKPVACVVNDEVWCFVRGTEA